MQLTRDLDKSHMDVDSAFNNHGLHPTSLLVAVVVVPKP